MPQQKDFAGDNKERVEKPSGNGRYTWISHGSHSRVRKLVGT